jgi:hypothetical protein
MRELLELLSDETLTTDQKLAALEDGALLASLGITDADQEAIEELYASLSN